MFARLETIQIS